MFDMNFCAIGFDDGPGPWWTVRDFNGNWVAVCDFHYDGPRNRDSSPNYPEYICVVNGCVRSRRWYLVEQPAFPPMPDQYVCERERCLRELR